MRKQQCCIDSGGEVACRREGDGCAAANGPDGLVICGKSIAGATESAMKIIGFCESLPLC